MWPGFFVSTLSTITVIPHRRFAECSAPLVIGGWVSSKMIRIDWRRRRNMSDAPDMVNHPPHYAARGGVECIDVAETMGFCRGNALKYVGRAGWKGGREQEIEDLKKARWYLDREIARLEAGR